VVGMRRKPSPLDSACSSEQSSTSARIMQGACVWSARDLSPLWVAAEPCWTTQLRRFLSAVQRFEQERMKATEEAVGVPDFSNSLSSCSKSPPKEDVASSSTTAAPPQTKAAINRAHSITLALSAIPIPQQGLLLAARLRRAVPPHFKVLFLLIGLRIKTSRSMDTHARNVATHTRNANPLTPEVRSP
jgi:hypothetical protein